MSTDAATAEHLADLLRGAGVISTRKMFGEYALYCDGKVVGLICDNQLFLKPTPTARTLLPEAATGLPYPGAKPYLLMDTELDDPPTLARIVAAMAADLPMPKPKKKR